MNFDKLLKRLWVLEKAVTKTQQKLYSEYIGGIVHVLIDLVKKHEPDSQMYDILKNVKGEPCDWKIYENEPDSVQCFYKDRYGSYSMGFSFPVEFITNTDKFNLWIKEFNKFRNGRKKRLNDYQKEARRRLYETLKKEFEPYE